MAEYLTYIGGGEYFKTTFIELLQTHQIIPVGYGFCFIDEFTQNSQQGLARFVQAKDVPRILSVTDVQDSISAIGANDLLFFLRLAAKLGRLQESKNQRVGTKDRIYDSPKRRTRKRTFARNRARNGLKTELESLQNIERNAQQRCRPLKCCNN